jgi:tripartite-type tricarboxylate transporter receptor subunit TctC
VVAKLNQSIGAALNDPTAKARLATLGDTVDTMPTADARAYVAALVEKWAKVIHAAKIKVA